MVVSLTPLLLAIVLLTALLPQLQTLKLAGLEAQTRQQPEVQLPTSPSVALPRVTEFAAASENFIDDVDISHLVVDTHWSSSATWSSTPATCQNLRSTCWNLRHPPSGDIMRTI